MITKERLDELLSYNPRTGVFTWRVRRNQFVSCGTVAGTPHSRGYIQIVVDGKLYLAHRLAFLTMTGRMPENEVDHINGVRNDNRWSNLRQASGAENSRNVRTRTDNTSGAPGVCWNARRGTWYAQIKADGKQVYLGRFTEFENAVAARRAAETKYHGEFSATTSRKILDAPAASC